jgi:adenine phosphoribosyltransferase
MIEKIKNALRDVPDFPKKGILFKDITPVLKDPTHFAQLVDLFYHRYISMRIDAVAAVEARGYLLAAPLAYRLGAGLIPVRKPGKLPCKSHKVTYDLEYGTDSLEMHEDALARGQRVLIVDDVLATGGTAAAAVSLVHKTGAEVVETAFLIELSFLKGRERLGKTPVHSLITF